ncbi:MAG: hypothetical protein PHV16_05065 [Candidatus Nanoarchaeia archaeon]|nr:hypothetical protein [Candidatus Nanoarchaeia archaeon]
MKAIILLSHGIDSPVAAYLMQKKGLELIGVNFFTTSYKDVEIIAKKLGIKKIHYIDHKNILSEIKNNTHPKYTCILCKRMMYRIAEKIAEKENAKFIVTGENLGQVASQTLDNLAVLEEAVEIPVLRPLLCLDKEEIVNIAKEIETYNLAKNVKCPFVPKRPATKADLKTIKREEMKLKVIYES